MSAGLIGGGTSNSDAVDALRAHLGGRANTSPLAAAVALAAEKLAADDPAAAQLLKLCAHLGPEPIPADLFSGHPDRLPEPLAGVARNPIAFGRTLALIGRYGLARITGSGPILHRLTQAILRDTDRIRPALAPPSNTCSSSPDPTTSPIPGCGRGGRNFSRTSWPLTPPPPATRACDRPPTRRCGI